MTLKKANLMIPGLILVCGLVLGIAVIGLQQDFSYSSPVAPAGKDLPVFQGQTGSLKIAAEFPVSPASVSLYRVISIDRIDDGNEKQAFSTKKTIPSAAEAPALAEKALEKYGGLPKEAQLSDAVPRYIKKFNLTTNSVEEQYPVATQVRYVQMLDGFPVIGAGINLDLGEDNEIIRILKIWPAYEYTGKGKVISAESGFEKLKKGDTLEKAQGSIPADTEISEIQFGYRLVRNGAGVKDPFLKPVWIYYAVTPLDPEPFPLMVDATA